MTKCKYCNIGYSEIGYWSLFDFWNLVIGYCHIEDVSQAPNFFNFNPLANMSGRISRAGNLPNSPF